MNQDHTSPNDSTENTESLTTARQRIELLAAEWRSTQAQLAGLMGTAVPSVPEDVSPEAVKTIGGAMRIIRKLSDEISETRKAIERHSSPSVSTATVQTTPTVAVVGGTPLERAALFDAVLAERDDLKSRVAELELTINTFPKPEAALQSAREQVGLLTVERDKAQAGWNREKINVERLESFCGVKGLDPSTLPPVASTPDDDGEVLFQRWQNMQGPDKTRFYRANEKKLQAYADGVRREHAEA